MEEIYKLLIEGDFVINSAIKLFKLGPGDDCYIRDEGSDWWSRWNGGLDYRVKKVTVLTDDEYFLEKI